MFRVSWNPYLQSFLGRRQISAMLQYYYSFIRGHTLLEHVSGLFFRRVKSCHCNICPIWIKLRMGNMLKDSSMSHGCQSQELQWFLPADENKQQITYYNLNRGVRKLKYDGLHCRSDFTVNKLFSPGRECCFSLL